VWAALKQRPTAKDLVSKDSTSGLIVAGITGSESDQQKYAKQLSEQVTRDRDGVTVRSGGVAMVNVQITDQSQRDLLLMESMAIPLSFLVLVWVFGGLLAAALPVAVGGMAILGALAVLRAISFATDVSIFALNLTTAMGLALAIDYTLLMISRYRDELDGGASRETAIVRTMTSAGRTVLFSATTVALSVAVMVRATCFADQNLFQSPSISCSGIAGRNPFCAGLFRSASRVLPYCLCSAHHSLGSDGGFLTTASCRAPPRPTKSATNCAAISSTTPRPR